MTSDEKQEENGGRSGGLPGEGGRLPLTLSGGMEKVVSPLPVGEWRVDEAGEVDDEEYWSILHSLFGGVSSEVGEQGVYHHVFTPPISVEEEDLLTQKFMAWLFSSATLDEETQEEEETLALVEMMGWGKGEMENQLDEWVRQSDREVEGSPYSTLTLHPNW